MGLGAEVITCYSDKKTSSRGGKVVDMLLQDGAICTLLLLFTDTLDISCGRLHFLTV
jgi:hypothetical protein